MHTSHSYWWEAHSHLQELYPDNWPTFFSDMLVAGTRDAARATMFARVLLALDEDVISLDIPRSDAGSRRSMAFKDAMRDRDVSAVVSTAISLVVAHCRSNPETARSMLTSLQRYVDWVDISLIVTQEFMALLRQLMQGLLPTEHILLLQTVDPAHSRTLHSSVLEFIRKHQHLVYMASIWGT